MKDGIHKDKGYEFHYRNHNLDREDGPAAIYPDGRVEYWKNGQYHREDAPAIVYPDGRMEWWLNGQRHRDIGPAIVNADGTEMWYQGGKLHRESGPAIEFSDGTHEWWLQGKQFTEDQFKAKTMKKAEIILSGLSYTELHAITKAAIILLANKKQRENEVSEASSTAQHTGRKPKF